MGGPELPKDKGSWSSAELSTFLMPLTGPQPVPPATLFIQQEQSRMQACSVADPPKTCDL